MALRDLIRTPFNEGAGTSSMVPFPWDCSINGRTFLYDEKYFGTQQHRLSSIPLLRPTQSTGAITEEALNPADGVRASVESWHHGAGQTFADRPDSDPYRFRSSKGIDPWTRYKLSLHLDTDQKRSSAETNLLLAVAGAYLALLDGTAIVHTTDADTDSPTWTAVTNSGGAMVSITSDGYSFTATDGSNIYQWAKDATATGVAWSTFDSDLLTYVKGRLMSAHDNVVSNITAAGAKTDVVTHANTDFRWVGFAEGLNHIYMAGYSGDKSLIYKTTIKADGTALDAGSVAGELPDGEVVTALGSYLGLVLIGTDKGVWVAEQDGNGNLTVNKVVDTAAAVRCFEGQGDFVWFGWTNYDTVSTGLGRMDLRSDTKGAEVLTPAFASDLMVTGQGAVLSLVTFGDQRVFTVSGSGVWAEHHAGNKVASGVIDGGLVTVGSADNKVALYVSVAHEPLVGSVAVALSANEGSFSTLGTSSTAGSSGERFNGGAATGRTFETRLTLTRDAVATTGPAVNRSTLEANMAPGRGQEMNLALLFFETLEARGGELTFDPVAAWDDLTDLASSGLPVTVQHVLGSVTATLDDYDLIIENFTEKRTGYVGTFLAKFRVPRRNV